MKKILTPALISLSLMGLMVCNTATATVNTGSLTDNKSKVASENSKDMTALAKDVSYIVGYVSAESSKSVMDVDFESFEQGFIDSLNEKDSKFSDMQSEQIFNAYQEKFEEREQEKLTAQLYQNAQASKEFLTQNKTKAGVITTESGLQYKIIKQGVGTSPTITDTVKVHYEGTLLNGEVFDNSDAAGDPVEFVLDYLIEGWNEGLQLMNKGSKYEFFIPSELAYGEMGNTVIEPNSLLIFTVEMIDFYEPQ